MLGRVTVANDSPPGARRGRVFTSQGGAGGLVFVGGELPEVIEKEIDGDAIPEPIKLPVTANGRIFPREDIDLWEFDAEAGKTVTAFAHAQSLNSPLAPRLEILDASGKVVAEQMLHACIGTDASVRFTPKAAGKYRVRISDARALGGPADVYRLTVTTEKVPEFHFPLKVPADGLKDATDRTATPPVALNGQIERPGSVGEWKLDLKKGAKYTFDLQARRYESPLCGVVTILDAAAQEVAKAEASETADPAPLAFTPSADGTCTVRVVERQFRGRGASFVYRLRVLDGTEKVEPGFRLRVASDTFTVPRAEPQGEGDRRGGLALHRPNRDQDDRNAQGRDHCPDHHRSESNRGRSHVLRFVRRGHWLVPAANPGRRDHQRQARDGNRGVRRHARSAGRTGTCGLR